jgi:hypothetical protein
MTIVHIAPNPNIRAFFGHSPACVDSSDLALTQCLKFARKRATVAV